MGYEIAGGIGVKMAQPGARGDRHGRRRQLPDAQLRDRHLGDARPQAHRSSCSTTAATAASTGCSRRWAARRSTTCSTIALQAGRGAPAIDFAAHARALGAHRRARGHDPELGGGAGARARVRPHVRDRRSTPIRRATTEAGRLLVGGGGAGGLGARGSRGGAAALRAGQASGRRHDSQRGGTRTLTSASASTRSRGATTTCPRWAARSRSRPRSPRARRSATRASSSATSFRASPKALGDGARPSRARAASRAGTRAELARAQRRRGDRGGRPAPRAARAQRRDGDGVRRGRRQHPGRSRSRSTSGRDSSATTQWRAYGERLTAFGAAPARRAACGSPITTTWVRTCRRPRTSTG